MTTATPAAVAVISLALAAAGTWGYFA